MDRHVVLRRRGDGRIAPVPVGRVGVRLREIAAGDRQRGDARAWGAV